MTAASTRSFEREPETELRDAYVIAGKSQACRDRGWV